MQCLTCSHRGSWNTKANEDSGNTRNARCLSHGGSGTARGKGSVLVASTYSVAKVRNHEREYKSIVHVSCAQLYRTCIVHVSYSCKYDTCTIHVRYNCTIHVRYMYDTVHTTSRSCIDCQSNEIDRQKPKGLTTPVQGTHSKGTVVLASKVVIAQ